MQLIRENYPNVSIYEVNENVGFSKANNIGAAKSTGNILYFQNIDIAYEQIDFFEKLLGCKNSTDSNIVGPRILGFDGKDPSGGKYLGMDVFSYCGVSDKPFYIEGCGLLITKQDFNTLGGFDDKYFMYSEDIDLCWRARIFGMSLAVCEDAKLFHYGGGISTHTRNRSVGDHAVPVFRRYEVEKNNLRNMLKNYGVVNILWTLPMFLALNILEVLLYLLLLKLSVARMVLGSIFWNIRNLKDTLIIRKYIQAHRKVGEIAIMKYMDIKINKLVAFSRVGIPKFL